MDKDDSDDDDFMDDDSDEEKNDQDDEWDSKYESDMDDYDYNKDPTHDMVWKATDKIPEEFDYTSEVLGL